MVDEHRVERPSPILRYFEDALGPLLPEPDFHRLTSYDAAVAATSAHGDLHRCLRCAEWAVGLAAARRQVVGAGTDRWSGRLGEVLRQVRDAGQAIEFALLARLPGVSATNVEMVAWIDDVVALAAEVARATGWEAVPWEDLLVELIGYEPPEDG